MKNELYIMTGRKKWNAFSQHLGSNVLVPAPRVSHPSELTTEFQNIYEIFPHFKGKGSEKAKAKDHYISLRTELTYNQIMSAVMGYHQALITNGVDPKYYSKLWTWFRNLKYEDYLVDEDVLGESLENRIKELRRIAKKKMSTGSSCIDEMTEISKLQTQLKESK